jgi:hypothetical protein
MAKYQFVIISNVGLFEELDLASKMVACVESSLCRFLNIPLKTCSKKGGKK